MKQLSQVQYEGRTWYFDGRLRQIRGVSNPHESRNLGDFEPVYFEDLLSRSPVETLDRK